MFEEDKESNKTTKECFNKKMNAFELINFCTGFGLNSIF